MVINAVSNVMLCGAMWILRVFHHVLLSFLGLYFGYFPFRAELFPPDSLLFLLQGGQAVAVFEFVLPAFTAQSGVHLCNGILPVAVRHLCGSAGTYLVFTDALFLTVASPVAGGDDTPSSRR